jgi:SAM-dependent methyltransferase
MPASDSELRRRWAAVLAGFQESAPSVGDPFGLSHADTPEWPRYLRTLRAAADYAESAPASPLALCDIGGYYGVMAAAIRGMGYTASVVDSYGPLMGSPNQELRAWWDANGLEIFDVDLQAADLVLPFGDHSVDVVTMLAVIEHFPHTPRLVLNEIKRILRPGGLFIVDTPNAGAFGVRVGFLMHGEGLWAPIEDVYRSDIPFPGHTRCYSRRELVAVLDWGGFEPVEVALFDLEEGRHSGIAARLLYDALYPALARRFPDLRNYLWAAARPRS